jgi:small nuclear ribonucleoprotein (snRNP)-like protein
MIVHVFQIIRSGINKWVCWIEFPSSKDAKGIQWSKTLSIDIDKEKAVGRAVVNAFEHSVENCKIFVDQWTCFFNFFSEPFTIQLSDNKEITIGKVILLDNNSNIQITDVDGGWRSELGPINTGTNNAIS